MVSLTSADRLISPDELSPLREPQRIGLVIPAVLARYNLAVAPAPAEQQAPNRSPAIQLAPGCSPVRCEALAAQR